MNKKGKIGEQDRISSNGRLQKKQVTKRSKSPKKTTSKKKLSAPVAKAPSKDQTFIKIGTAIFTLLFAILIGYLIYFTAIKQKQISVHPYNTRLNNLEQEVVRGDIYDTNMKVLATTKEEKRYYPKGAMYAHAIGYSQRGKTGIEALANTELLYPDYTLPALFKNAFLSEKFEGRDIVLTLDDRYQEAIAQAMDGQKGAVVVMEPSTGKIRAMYSNPGFDPNNINEKWETLIQDTTRSPLVNRATNGLYPPGSIFKTITALSLIEQHPDLVESFVHDCTGQIKGEDYVIQCYNKKAHGEVDFKKAFNKSCNTYFVKLTEVLDNRDLRATAEKLGFNKALHFDMDHAISKFQLLDAETGFEQAATYIGQGKTLVTPIHMAMIASCIVNDGIMMKPYMLDYSMGKKGTVKVKYLPEPMKPSLTEMQAKMMREMMTGVVEEGTATKIKRSNLVVGGKTGTAQNETSEDHSWFMGFAKDKEGQKSDIAFAVIVENGGIGSKALNVTQKILDVYESIKP